MNLLNKVYHNACIRPLQLTDADNLYHHYLGQKELALYLARQPHKSLEQSQDFIHRCIESYQQSNPSMLVFAVAEPDSNTAFGMLTLIFNHDHAEIHFGISAQYSGLGTCTQVCRAGVEYLTALGIHDIRTQLHIDHIASRRVLEKNGFTCTGVLREFLCFPAMGEQLQDCIDMRRVHDESGQADDTGL